HLWTLSSMLRRPRRPALDDMAWTVPAVDGPPLCGLWQAGPDRSVAVIILHGLGGRPRSGVCVQAAAAVARRGWSSLRLAVRTHPEHGPDYRYDHLAQDIHSALESPQLTGFKSVVLWGFSVGGAAAVRIATAPPHPAIRAVVAVCPPMDDTACEAALRRPTNRVYKAMILRKLTAIHARDARHFGRRAPPSAASWAPGVRAWERIVSSTSRPPMPRPTSPVRVPTLVVASLVDPLVPFDSMRAALPDGVELRVGEGGHVYFRPNLDLGEQGERGLMPQVVAWLKREAVPGLMGSGVDS
ncbi:MAG: putative alpha/beta-fold hydrolase, partial [Bradymonadia bacterium]